MIFSKNGTLYISIEGETVEPTNSELVLLMLRDIAENQDFELRMPGEEIKYKPSRFMRWLFDVLNIDHRCETK